MVYYDKRRKRWAVKEKQHTYYRVCPNCGSNLDPGEICDCMKGEEYDKQEKQPPRSPRNAQGSI